MLHFGKSSDEVLVEQCKTNPLEKTQNACDMCTKLYIFNLTLKRQLSGCMDGLMLPFCNKSGSQIMILSFWLSGLQKHYAILL